MPGIDRTFDASGGRLAGWVWGEPDQRPVICVPGLTANSRTFASLASRLAADGRFVVALDLRGRGYSETTDAGTYGWPAHAADVVAVADELGAEEIDVVGHSMGAFVALQLAADHPGRSRRTVLVDAVGLPEADALAPIAASMGRLGQPAPSAAEYIDAVKASGVVDEWGPLWENYYRYELTEDPDGSVRSRTSLAAVMEDATWAGEHDVHELWPAMTGPVMLVRATRPLGANGGLILSAPELAAFCALNPHAAVVEIDANHYGVIAAAASIDAIASFLAI